MARAPALAETEATPEADRLEGFPHPRETEAVLGHEAAEAAFAEQFQAGRLHHAWLLAGPEGIGKATLAYRIARYVLAAPEQRGRGEEGKAPLAVPPASVAARQVKVLSHPGLLVIRRPWEPKTKRFITTIPIDEVRRLRSFLAFSAGPDAWRVVIVDQADELNINAANALLKSLEEPPPRALFLLVSSQPGRLLTTIRSRCRRVELSALGDSDLRIASTAALAAAGAEPVPGADWARLIAQSHGSVRRLLVLTRAEGAGLATKVMGLLGLLPKIDWPQVHALADEVAAPGADQRFEQLYALLLDTIARVVRASAIGAGTPDEQRLAARLVPDGGLATWAELWETVGARKAETVALNLDRKALVLETFALLQQAARG